MLFGAETEAVSRAKDGSVRLALEIRPPFARHVLIDRSIDHVVGLESLREDFPQRSIEILHGDANRHLVELCRRTDWRRTRAAVFLDPYGMQLNWSTLECLAATRGDIALLFPTGPLNRMLRRDGAIPEEWQRRIDDHLGPCDWRDACYRPVTQRTLFDGLEASEKAINVAGLRAFVFERLRSIFAFVHEEAVPLANSKGAVLYHLFIICANRSDKAKRPAGKLAAGAIKAVKKKGG